MKDSDIETMGKIAFALVKYLPNTEFDLLKEYMTVYERLKSKNDREKQRESLLIWPVPKYRPILSERVILIRAEERQASSGVALLTIYCKSGLRLFVAHLSAPLSPSSASGRNGVKLKSFALIKLSVIETS